MLDVLLVESAGDGLGFHGGLVNSAVAVVHNLLRMAKRPAGIDSICLVAGVGGRTDVAAQDGVGQRAVVDGSCEAAIALAMILAVPPESGQPDFEFNVRI